MCHILTDVGGSPVLYLTTEAMTRRMSLWTLLVPPQCDLSHYVGKPFPRTFFKGKKGAL